jgi:hypothetical protein
MFLTSPFIEQAIALIEGVLSVMGMFRQLTLALMLFLCAKHSRATEQPHGNHEPTDCQRQLPFVPVRGNQRVGASFLGCFRIPSESSEYSSDLEEELSVAVVADGASGFHRSKPCINDECPNDVTRNVGRPGTVRKLVRLADLEDP